MYNGHCQWFMPNSYHVNLLFVHFRFGPSTMVTAQWLHKKRGQKDSGQYSIYNPPASNWAISFAYLHQVLNKFVYATVRWPTPVGPVSQPAPTVHHTVALTGRQTRSHGPMEITSLFNHPSPPDAIQRKPATVANPVNTFTPITNNPHLRRTSR